MTVVCHFCRLLEVHMSTCIFYSIRYKCNKLCEWTHMSITTVQLYTHVESSRDCPTQHHHLTLFTFYGNLSPSPSKGNVASLRFTHSQWSLSCWAIWHPIEVLLSPEDTVQIIIGFISVGDVDFLNELTLSSCLSSPFSLSHGSQPPILFSLFPPYIALQIWSFSYHQVLGPFFPAFVPVGGEGANSRIDPTFVSWYCSKPSLSIGMGSALTGGGWGCENEIGWGFFISLCTPQWLAFCVQWNVPNLAAIDMQMSTASSCHVADQRHQSLGKSSAKTWPGLRC